MSKPNLSTYGGRLLDMGFAGQVADEQNTEIESKKLTGATAMDFGIAVVRDGANPGGIKVQSADADKIIGISVRHPIRPADVSGNVVYNQNDMVPVMRRGNIYATALENVTDGDAVIAVVAQGGKLGSVTGGAAGAGRITVPNAVWEGATTAGQIGRIRISG